MISRILWPLILLILLGGIAWKAHRAGVEVDYYSPEAFVKRANYLIVEKGLLKADCSEDPIQIDDDPSQLSDEEKIWFERSYLKNDVKRFNDHPETYGWTFLIDEACTLRGVNPVVHTIQLPFRQRLRWLGNIYLRGEGADASLRSAGRSLQLRRPLETVPVERDAWTKIGRSQAVIAENIKVHYGGGQTRPAGVLHSVGETIALKNEIRDGEGTIRLLGHTLPEGRHVWLRTGDWLHFSGPEGKPRETFIYTAGAERDAISVVRQRNERFERSTDDEPLGWLDESRGDEPMRLLDGLVTSLSNALNQLPPEQGRALEQGFDLKLTLDRQLQQKADQVLRNFSRGIKTKTGTFSAGITVLDGQNGDLLALASFPHPDDTDADPTLDPRRRRRLLLNQNFILHPIGSAGKPFFFAGIAHAHPAFLNLKLEAHPEEDKRQDLLQCRLRFGYQVLGSGLEVDFARAIEASSNRYTVELAFLALAAESADPGARWNRLIGTADPTSWPLAGQRSGLSLGEDPLDFAPNLSGHVDSIDRVTLKSDETTTAVETCLAVARMDQLEFREPLSGVTGVSTYRGEDPRLPNIPTPTFYRSYGNQRYDLGPIRPLAEYLIGSPEDPEDELSVREWKLLAEQIKGALQPIAPERVNLAFNHLTDLRQDYVSLLLGGANSIWTNIQLAESLARLVTDQDVDARLIAEVLPSPTEDEDADDPSVDLPADDPPVGLEPFSLDPAVRQAVLRGMERVVAGTSGTAKALRDELNDLRGQHPGRDIRLYSKTGSPRILIPVPRLTSETLTELMKEGLLTLDGQTLVLRVGGAITPHQPARQNGRAAFVQALARAVRSVARESPKIRESSKLRRSVLRQLDQFQRDVDDLTFPNEASLPDDIPSPLMIVGQQLRLNRSDPLFTQNLEREKGAVYMFTLVSMPQGVVADDQIPSPEILADPGTRVLSVALHIDVGPDSEVAVQVAEKLLPVLTDSLRPRS